MVNNICAVSGCGKESYPGCGLSFHSLPSDLELMKKWLEVIPYVCQSSVVCSLHFKPEDYRTEARKRLKPGVTPSILPKRDHSNGSVDLMSNETSDCDSDMQDSDSETSKSEPKHSVSDRLEVFGKNVALKLQELPENQRVIAEEIINEALSMAQNGSLTMAHALNFAKDHKSSGLM